MFHKIKIETMHQNVVLCACYSLRAVITTMTQRSEVSGDRRNSVHTGSKAVVPVLQTSSTDQQQGRVCIYNIYKIYNCIGFILHYVPLFEGSWFLLDWCFVITSSSDVPLTVLLETDTVLMFSGDQGTGCASSGTGSESPPSSPGGTRLPPTSLSAPSPTTL